MRLLRSLLVLLALLATVVIPASRSLASEEEKPVERDYSLVKAPPAPARQSVADVKLKSAGCLSCHVETDAPTMHATPAVRLGCVDCHGGNASVHGDPELGFTDAAYVAARERAHVLPRYPESWHYPSSANPKRSYALLNRESPEFVRFNNPGDLRIAREACGACHMPIIEAAERSLMASGGLCATVIRLDPMLIVGFAAESQVDRLAEGALAGARLSNGMQVTGRVTFLARSADAATRTFRVEVTVPNTDLAIRDGLSADMLVAATATRGHLVPGSALTLNDDGTLGLRLVDDTDHTFFQPVTVLRDAPQGFWVSGLPTVADVIVVGQEYVTDGIAVRVTRREQE